MCLRVAALLVLMSGRVLAGIGTCDDLSAVVETPAVDYDAQIQPIFNAHCVHCHGPPDPSAFMDLSAGPAMLVDVESFEIAGLMRVRPGEFYNSYLFIKINCADQLFGDRMPRDAAPLSLFDQALVRDWITQLLIFRGAFE